MKLIGPLLLLGLLSLVEGELSENFTNCRQYFVNNNAPTILGDQNKAQRYREICQRFGQNTPNYRYATLYDTANRIPVYSAYWYSGRGCDRKRRSWMIEPQLDGGNDVTMMTQFAAKLPGLLCYQAVDDDYKSSKDFQRGHLYPHSHNTNCDSIQTLSTYTLTNAAPQGGSDNIKWYWEVEYPMANNIDYYCLNKEAYIVTGVVPGNNKMNNRVNIPAYFWSAVCCEDKNKSGHYISVGAYMQMGMGEEEKAQWVTIGQLSTNLANDYGQAFGVFGQQIGCS